MATAKTSDDTLGTTVTCTDLVRDRSEERLVDSILILADQIRVLSTALQTLKIPPPSVIIEPRIVVEPPFIKVDAPMVRVDNIPPKVQPIVNIETPPPWFNRSEAWALVITLFTLLTLIFFVSLVRH